MAGSILPLALDDLQAIPSLLPATALQPPALKDSADRGYDEGALAPVGDGAALPADGDAYAAECANGAPKLVFASAPRPLPLPLPLAAVPQSGTYAFTQSRAGAVQALQASRRRCRHLAQGRACRTIAREGGHWGSHPWLEDEVGHVIYSAPGGSGEGAAAGVGQQLLRGASFNSLLWSLIGDGVVMTSPIAGVDNGANGPSGSVDRDECKWEPGCALAHVCFSTSARIFPGGSLGLLDKLLQLYQPPSAAELDGLALDDGGRAAQSTVSMSTSAACVDPDPAGRA